MKHWLFVAVTTFLVLSARADSEGEQLMGTQPCPFGMSWAKWYFNGRLIAAVCMSTAEFERASYVMKHESGELACRALVIKGRQ